SSMRISFPLVAVAIVFLFAACSKNEPLPGIRDTTQSVQPQANGDAVNRVASDKELLRQALILSDSKGTLVPALTEAAQDSIVGIKMREALVLGYEAKQKASSPKKNGSKDQGDVLDKTNNSLDKANQEIDKAGNATNKARSAGQKINDIFNGH